MHLAVLVVQLSGLLSTVLAELQPIQPILCSTNDDCGTNEFCNGDEPAKICESCSSDCDFGDDMLAAKNRYEESCGKCKPSVVTEQDPDDAEEDYDPVNNTWRDYVFMAFRFGLFFFIICFPCLRGLRVWYMAGGRIRFRRTGGVDEDGRSRGWIIGLRYQQADLDRWLILSGYGQPPGRNGGAGGAAGDSGIRKLTADEVYALPEIDAPKIEDDVLRASGRCEDLETGNDELAATYHGMHCSTNNNNTDNDDSETLTDATSDGLSSIELTSIKPTEKVFTTTMSTSCSICIDDFEEGEKIRLLPRCGHAFHTECLLPWLTERQGCCPTCKTPVTCPPVTEEDKENNGEGNNTNDNNSRGINSTPNSIRISTNEGIRIFLNPQPMR